MLSPPVLGVVNLDVRNALIASPAGGNSKPRRRSLMGLDSISVSPISNRILNVVEEYKDIDRLKDVEIAAPRYIARLNDSDTAHADSAAAPDTISTTSSNVASDI